jgi:hypothetical protein
MQAAILEALRHCPLSIAAGSGSRERRGTKVARLQDPLRPAAPAGGILRVETAVPPRSSLSQVTMKRIAIWTVGSMAALSCALSAGPGQAGASTSSHPTPSELLSKTLTDATNAGWVHEAIQRVGSGHSLSMVNDIGSISGRQVIDADGGRATVLLVNGSADVRSDDNALQNYFGLPSSVDRRLSNQWFSVPKGSSAYYTVTDAVTLETDFGQALLIGTLREGKARKVDGVMAIPIKGSLANAPNGERIPATMFVTAALSPLPVAFSASKDGFSQSIQWSNWGHAVSLVAPTRVVSLTHVLG